MTGDALLKAAGPWQETSAQGRTYFVGRLGGVTVLVLENTRRQDESEPSHNLFFAEAPDRPRPDARPQPVEAAPERADASASLSLLRPEPDRPSARAKRAAVAASALVGANGADGFDWANGEPLPFWPPAPAQGAPRAGRGYGPRGPRLRRHRRPLVRGVPPPGLRAAAGRARLWRL